MRLTNTGAQLYLSTSQVTLACGALSWDEYLLRLRFVRDCGEPDTLEARFAADILRREGLETEDEWQDTAPDPLAEAEGPKESAVSISDSRGIFQPPILHFIAAASTGLHRWKFNQGDTDYFPSIPHGHSQSSRRRKLDAYRGWIYQEDRQIGREPRWKFIALWNDEKFRAFAHAAIQHYLIAYPRFEWRVPYPLRLPRRRKQRGSGAR